MSSAPMHRLEEYASFLVKLWTLSNGKESAGTSWQAEVESIQTGERWRFASPDELSAFLVQVLQANSPAEGAD